MYLKELTHDEFTRFVEYNNTKSIFQTIPYARVMSEQGFEYKCVGLIDNTTIVAGALIFIRKNGNFKYAYSPRGLLVDYANEQLLSIFTSELKKYLGRMNVVAIKISPMLIKSIMDDKGNIIGQNRTFDISFGNLTKFGYVHLGYNNFFEGIKPRFEAILNLKEDYRVLFKNIKKEFRSKIRNSEKYGIRIFQGNNEDVAYLYKQTEKKYPRDMNYFNACYRYYSEANMIDFYYAKVDTRLYLEEIQKSFHAAENESNYINDLVINNSANNTKKIINRKINADTQLNVYKNKLISATAMLRDHPQGIVVSTVLVVKHGKTVEILMDGYDSQYKDLNAKHLIIWKIIEKYSKLGFESFILGGLSNIKIMENRFRGVNEFRLNFNAKAYEYVGDFELVTNKTLYIMYKNLNKKTEKK